MKNSGFSTELLIIVILLIIGGVVWWYSAYGPGSAKPAQQQPAGLQVNVTGTGPFRPQQ